jgi:hypothetical protein
MTKSYRIRTTPGIDKNIRINVEQDFDLIEILSLKLKQEDVYTRFCADYGVVAGRVIANGGFGVPNVPISVFVPLTTQDSSDPVISTLYPYKALTDKNEDGYRYNLLPYIQENQGHTPTGTFPDVNDLLTRTEVLEVYEKYYKYTVRTNDSGDFMIVGVPLGMQSVVMDMDLSNIGCFSQRPSDLVRQGLGVESQFAGSNFKSSENLDSLPQVVNQAKDVEVASFWGETDICNVGITRVDFDLRDIGVEIQPQAIFMGSMFSTSEDDPLGVYCKPTFDSGNLCDLVSSQGKILALRQTIYNDNEGFPVIEEHKFEQGGNIIDENGTWLVEVPMNLDYVSTNEFGEDIFSNDPSIGIPTKGKYRFRIQYQNEDGNENSILRADYLVPNIKEYGWNSGSINGPYSPELQQKSYAFSLEWKDYGEYLTNANFTGFTQLGYQMVQEAINCEDRFFEFNYNRVYTVASHIDRWKWGYNRSRHLGIKEITNRECSTTTNRFPVNDGVRNFDFIFFLFNLLITVLSPVFIIVIIILHVLAFIYPIVVRFINRIIAYINGIIYSICNFVSNLGFNVTCNKETLEPLSENNPFKRISLPMISYPDCEACNCEDTNMVTNTEFDPFAYLLVSNGNFGQLINSNSLNEFVPTLSGSSLNNGVKQGLSGYQYLSNAAVAGYIDLDPKLVKLPIVETPNQGGGYKYLGDDVTLSQSLNMANFRRRYFDNENIIKTTVNNSPPGSNIPQPSNSFTDSILMIVCDTGTLQILKTGDLVSFHNISKLNDPNLTGGTLNQFNNKKITGSTNPNQTSLITKTVTFITTGGTSSTATLKLRITGGTKTYDFPAGNEYFQVITGGTAQQFSGLTNFNNPNGLLNKYLFNKSQRVKYNEVSPIPPGQLAFYQKPFSYYSNYQNQEIIFLSRGVDPYTEKQNIRYDLSMLFGYTFNQGPIVEGGYHLNIPIQPTANTVINNSIWRSGYVSPQSHSVTNSQNAPYHQPFSFTVSPTSFTAFTNNVAKYYNSTDKSRSTYKAFSSDTTSLQSYTSPAGVYSDIAYNTPQLGKSTIGFQYGSTIVNASNPGTSTYTWLSSTATWAFKNNTEGQSIIGAYVPGSCQNVPAGIPCSNGNVGACENITTGGPNFYTNVQSIQTGQVFYTDPALTIPVVGQINSLTGVYMWRILQYQAVDPQTGAPTWLVAIAVSINNIGVVTDLQICIGNWQGVGGNGSQPPNLTSPQGNIEGGSFFAGAEIQGTAMPSQPTSRKSRVFSPAYHLDTLPNITMNSSTKLLLRSDRLPTSDITEVSGNTSYSLHLNNNFLIYKLTEGGLVIDIPVVSLQATDTTNNLQDLEDSGIGISNDVLGSLACENMTLLSCYSGSGENFGVDDPCPENNPGNPQKQRVMGGCYYFVQDELIKTIPDDIKYFIEWKARFRFVFGACRGVISHVFQNNWVNGTLYAFSFRKKTIYDAVGNVKKYKFCGANDSLLLPITQNQGPIYYDKSRFSFFYRSTPYDATIGGFVGQQPRKKNVFGTWIDTDYGGMNDKNLFFPTTIMDLGPRDQFAKEICFNPQLEGYLVDTIKSTSYNETGDILLFFILSRLLSTSFGQQLTNSGDASINTLFSRTQDRIDGDIAQMFSINSEYGVLPFTSEFYDNNDIYLAPNTNDGPLIGALFSAITENRILLTPGTVTFGSTTQTVGYPKTQIVPMYKWKKDNNNIPQTILGSQDNDWWTTYDSNNKYYSAPYQQMSFSNTDYFQATNGPQKGYIYNYTNTGIPTFNPSNNQTSDRFVVGAPYHFYFGLGKGKTSLNRYITKYIIP